MPKSHRRHRRTQAPQSKVRQGSVLIVVLILVVLLSLAALKYSASMLTEYSSANMYGRRLQTQQFADSGVEMTADLLGNRTFETTENLIHDESAFLGVSIQESDIPYNTGRVTLIAPNERDPDSSTVRYGLISESGKLNLNALLAWQEQYSETDPDTGEDLGVMSVEFYDKLASIPAFEDQAVVDLILDYIDEDDDPRPNGAEQASYTDLGYECKNGPLDSMDELLRIPGITAEILYGEDGNRNGILDANEDDGDKSAPSDNEDGVLDLGLMGYCTVRSTESNLRGDRTEKINLNQGLMTELYDAVLEEFDDDTATFVVAFRMWGSLDAQLDEDGSSLTASQEEVAQAVGGAIAGETEGTVTRNGMDLSQPAQFEFTAIFDLVDAEVEATINGTPVTLASPWQSGSLSDTLPLLFDTFGLTDDAFIGNRIDPNYARKEVLMAIPEITPDIAEAAAASSVVSPEGDIMTDVLESHATPGWLFTEGIVDLETMRKIEPYLTTRGDIYRTQIVGHFDEGGPFTRLEALIDGSEYPAKVLSVTDLTSLGRGYSNEQLGLEPEE